MPVVISDPTAANKAVVLARNVFEDFAWTGSGHEAGNPVGNMFTDSTYDFARRVVSDNLSATTTAGPATVSAMGVSGHNIATSAGSFLIQRSSDGSSWVNVITPYFPLTNDDLFFIFPRVTANRWRVVITGIAGKFVSNIKLGDRLDFPCTPIDSYTPIHHSRRYEKYFNKSINGQFLGTRVRSVGATTEVNFPLIPRDFVDGPLVSFANHYNRGRTFFYAGWPGGKPQDMGYCQATGQNDMVQVEYVQGSRLANLSFGVDTFGTP